MPESNQNTPERTLFNFLDCWKRKEFKRMIEFLQITWKSEHEKRGTDIKNILKRSFFGFKELIYFEIKPRKEGNEILADMEAVIKYKCLGKVSVKRIRPRMICEIEAYRPSKDGKWGVNPISALREF